MHYCWEQLDTGKVDIYNFGPYNHLGAQARSMLPSISPVRVIPEMSAVLEGDCLQSPDVGQWETVSLVDRTMTWAVTVRDRFPASTNGSTRMAFDIKA